MLGKTHNKCRPASSQQKQAQHAKGGFFVSVEKTKNRIGTSNIKQNKTKFLFTYIVYIYICTCKHPKIIL